MKLVEFDKPRKEWFIPMKVNGKDSKAFLDVHSEKNQEEAFLKAMEIVDTMTNHYEEELQEIPMGSLDDYSEDFRCML